MSTRKSPPQPVGLAGAGRALWRAIAPVYELRPDELAVLTEACRVADTLAELEAARAEAPLLSKGHAGQDVIHPFVSEQRFQRAALAGLLRQLKLPDERAGIKRNGHTSEQARAAAIARWRPTRGA